jgi:hypothetical protein
MQPATSRTDALSDVDGLTAHMSEMLNFSETSNVLPIVGMCEKVGWFQISNMGCFSTILGMND